VRTSGRRSNWRLRVTDPVHLPERLLKPAAGLALMHLLAAGEVATFIDQLAISGIVAYGVVKTFFA